MTILSIAMNNGANNKMVGNMKTRSPNYPMRTHRRTTVDPVDRPLPEKINFDPNARQLIEDVEAIIASGQPQQVLVDYFKDFAKIPKRIGDWEIRVHEYRQEDTVVSRTIVPIPYTVPARKIFEMGRLKALALAGYDEATARLYYRAAWKRKYVWVAGVMEAVKEMTDAFQNTAVLEKYLLAPNPRQLAQNVAVPENPYQVSQANFLVAVEMAIAIINARRETRVN